MAVFNNHPYKTIKLTRVKNGVESTVEYSEIKIDGTSVWRKPISYTRTITIVDPDDYTNEIVADAVSYGAFSGIYNYGVMTSGSGSVYSEVPVPEPADNDDLSNPNIIKYRDLINYSMTPKAYFEIAENNSTFAPRLLKSILNDFVIDVKLAPKKFKFTLNGDDGIDFSRVTITRVCGDLSQRLGESQTVSFTVTNNVLETTSPLYYLDNVTVTVYSKTGYSIGNNEEFITYNFINYASDVSYNLNSTLKTYDLNLNSSAGVASVTLKRTYRRLPSPSSGTVVISSGSGVINYGDNIKVEAVAEQNYTLNNEYPISYLNVTNNLNVSVSAHRTYAYLYIVKDSSKIQSVTVVDYDRGLLLEDDDVVNEGDTLEVTVTPKPGYTSTTPSSVTVHIGMDGGTYNLEITAEPTPYLLGIPVDDDSISTYTITRTSSPIAGAPTGTIYNGTDNVYIGDVLSITYTSKPNYVVGDDYATSYTVVWRVDASDTQSDVYVGLDELAGTYTTPLVLTQCGVSGTALDSEDLTTLRIWYPDDEEEYHDYDPNKRVRIDRRCILVLAEQSLNTNFTSISDVKYSNGTAVFNYITSGQVYAYGFYSHTPVKVYFEPKAVNLKFYFYSEGFKSIYPDKGRFILSLMSSKYKGTPQTDYTTLLYDYNIHSSSQTPTEVNITAYYKDNFFVNAEAITGWVTTYARLKIGDSSWRTFSLGGYTSLDVSGWTNYELRISRYITSYRLTFHNKYAKYFSIIVDGEQKLTSDWLDYDGGATKTFYADYGTIFRYRAEALPNNDPMVSERRSHDPNTDYRLTTATDVYYENNLKLNAPGLVEVDADIYYRGDYYAWRPEFKFRIYNANNSSGGSYVTYIKLEYSESLTNGQPTYSNLDKNAVVYTTNGFNTNLGTIYSDRYFYGDYQDHLVYYKATIYFKGKTVSDVPREDSNTKVIYFTVNIPAE